ncbi:MAG: RNA 2',3'-cyclic phosphodiesterase [Endomicrobia bacterium]|nr:RNA 2',3'-cyclic phosphodiesterase [Endomicrobiia bacterium]
MRTFIAVELQKDVIESINNFVFKTYREIDSNKISWVKKENLHITLKFLGEIDEKQVEIVKTVLKEILQNKKGFLVSVEGVCVFPKINSPRVIWLGIKEGKDELKTLANLIEEELYKNGFPKESKEFTAHLTIARIKQIKRLEEVRNYVEKYKNYPFGISRVKDITFFQSILKPEGPEYRVINKFILSSE